MKKEYKFIPTKGETKVTTDKLFIRDGKPDSQKVVRAGEAQKGEILQFIGYVLDGESVNGNSKWYLNSQGNFYWSGGVSEIKTERQTPEKFSQFIWPLKKSFQRISQSFGEIWSANSNKQHTGADIPAPPGQQVFACASGKIVKVGNLDAHGKWAQYIVIKHDSDGYCSSYLHVDPKQNVKIGKKVKAKQVIASVANIGANHLHFNLWRGSYRAITARGALPLPENEGKIYPESDPAFPADFVNPMSFNYLYLE